MAGSVEERVLHDTRALVYRLASWAADNSAMGRVLQLPLMGMEEQVRGGGGSHDSYPALLSSALPSASLEEWDPLSRSGEPSYQCSRGSITSCVEARFPSFSGGTFRSAGSAGMVGGQPVERRSTGGLSGAVFPPQAAAARGYALLFASLQRKR